MISKFFEKDNSKTILLFTMAVYFIALMEILIRLPNVELFYGSLHMITEMGENNGINFIFDILLFHPKAYLIVTYSYIAVLLINLTNMRSILTKTLAWYFCGVLNYYNPSIADGGSAIILIFLFYSIFLNKSSNYYIKSISNLFLLMVQLQVCFIYLSAGLTKLNGQLWTRGVATYYALQIDQFSHPFLQEYFAKSAFLVTLSSLGTLAFQLSFPYLVWNKRTKYYVILVGSFLHLQISFGMGLVTFGLIMSVSYISFYDSKKALRVLRQLSMSPIKAYFDSQCTQCMRFSKLMRYLTPSESIIVKDARQKGDHYLNTLHVKDGDKIHQGFAALAQILYRAPLLNILSPIIFLIDKSKIGEYFYDRIILNSKWRQSCKTGNCSLSFTQQ